MTVVLRNILNSHLATASTTATVAWENTPYTPQSGETHLRVSYLPSRTRPAGNHKSAMDFESGVYQIDVYTPQNQGTSTADALASLIREHFYRGLRLTDGSGNVLHIQESPSEAAGQREGAFWRIRVTIPWFAYVPAVA